MATYFGSKAASGSPWEIELPVGLGHEIVIPAAPAPSPGPVEDRNFYEWPQFLVEAIRSTPDQKIVTTRHTTLPMLPPTVVAPDGYERMPEGGGRRQLKPDERAKIGGNRASVPTGKLGLGQDLEYKTVGWVYNGRSPSQLGIRNPANDGASAGSLPWAQASIWRELGMIEGGVASINAYDRGLVTWGQGWAWSGGPGGLKGLMNRVWTRPDCAGIKTSLLDHGIAWDKALGRFLIVNRDGYMETGDDALNLLMGTAELLAVLIKAGEDVTPQAMLDAEYDLFMSKKVSQVPASVYGSWDQKLIMFAGHAAHMWPGTEWKWPGASTIDKFLMAWGPATWVKRESGAYTKGGRYMIEFFEKWGGGIALAELRTKCPNPLEQYTEKDLKNDANLGLFGGLLAILGKDGTHYHFYPNLPPLLQADDELYAFVGRVAGFDIDAVLKEAEAVKGKLQGFRAIYDDEHSRRTTLEFGLRVRVAVDAVIVKKFTTNKAAQRKTVYDQYEFTILPGTQQDKIRVYLGDARSGDDAWDYWDGGDTETFFSMVQVRSMPHLISTLSARNYTAVDQVRQTYESAGQPYGPRLWIAIMAVLNRGGGGAASWILNHGGYRGLAWDQRKVIRQTIGVPFSNDVLRAENIDDVPEG